MLQILKWFLTRRRIIVPVLLIGVMVGVGTVGYMIIDDFPLFEAFYMTIITIATVGYGEIMPLSKAGRLFTAGLIISSFGTFAYAISQLTRYVVEGEFNDFFKKRRQKKVMQRLENHVIVCGYGRNGRQAAAELARYGNTVVVVEINQEEDFVEDAETGIIFLKGDATNDEVLLQAGIKKAQALICTLPHDADNVFIVLSARSLHRTLRIISRAGKDTSLAKLRTAGANHVIMPDKVGGAHMASLVARPYIVEFLETLELSEDIHLDFVEMTHGFPIAHSWGSLQSEIQSNLTFLGLKPPGENILVHPSHDKMIVQGSKIFVLGDTNQVMTLRNYLKV